MAKQKIKLSKIRANIGQIEGLKKNPRVIKDSKLALLVKSLQESPELLEHRGLLVFPYDNGKKYVTIGGNQRLAAAKEAGFDEIWCEVLDEDTSIDKLNEYIIKDNASFGEWDFDDLNMEWDAKELTEWGLDLCFDNLNADDDSVSTSNTKVEQDEVPEVSKRESFSKMGDIWHLGAHRLICGDSTDQRVYEALMNGEKAVLCFTDPPYGMGKEAEGVLNDNLNFSDLLEFNKKWVPLTMQYLTEVGSWYCWGIDEPLIDIYSEILKPMKNANEITFRHLITWDKTYGQGQLSDGFRMYPIADEKCLFVMKGVQDFKFERNEEKYNVIFEPIRTYLDQERKKSGLTYKQLCEIDSTRCSHYWAKVQFEFPTKSSYEKLQKGTAVFQREYEDLKREYEDLKREYEDLKREYYATRAYFDNTHDNQNNVWHFDRTNTSERDYTGGHATPKPLALCARGIKSSSREGDLVIDVFGGSGSTLIACEQLGRRCNTIELDPKYCDVIVQRYCTLTRDTDIRLTRDGETKVIDHFNNL